MTSPRHLSPASVDAFWEELRSIEKTAGLANIISSALRSVGAERAADVVTKKGDELSNAVLRLLLKEGPGPRVLPRPLLSATAEKASENPHLAPLLGTGVPGSFEGPLLAQTLLEKLILKTPPRSAEREAILKEFAERDVRRAPWVEPTESALAKAYEKWLKGKQGAISAAEGAQTWLKEKRKQLRGE